jgi:hypothetical protein
VFELSGEEKARKGDTLNDSFQAGWSYGKPVLFPKQYKHPTPHKGVLIYNGPVSVTFNDRNANCISPNDGEFVSKRFLCIIPFHELVGYSKNVLEEKIKPEQLWEEIHKTSGLLNSK